MIPEFKFIKPTDLREALVLMDKYREGGRAVLVAGGTDVIPALDQEHQRFKNMKVMVDIHGLRELKTVHEKDGRVFIGGATTLSRVMDHPLIREYYPVLTRALGSIGAVQTRNRATIAGNVVNNAPCADSVPALLVYDASVIVNSLKGTREMTLEDFLVRPYETRLGPDEIVTRIALPLPGYRFRGKFYKLGRRRGVAVSRISLALLVATEINHIRAIRIAGGAVTPIGKRFRRLENFARDKRADPDLFRHLAREMAGEILYITGLRWSGDYKIPVLQQVFFQLLEGLCGHRATGGTGEESDETQD